jgi:dolichol-phosphate mannosyltransferase
MMTPSPELKLLSIVVSVFNEEQVLDRFWESLLKEINKLSCKTEVIFVNDGSTDGSDGILRNLAAGNGAIRVVSLSMNFGHEAAMIAGVDFSKGDSVICMDADLQHPPNAIHAMVQKFIDGYEVVNMVRTSRQDKSMMKSTMSSLFYWFINKISPVRFEPNGTDFFLISRRVANILKKEYRENTRFLRGYIQVLGFRKTRLEFNVVAREAGESKYSFYRLLVLSVDAIAAFSRLPLKLGLIGGIICSLFGFLVIMYSVYKKFSGDYVPSGYTTIVVLISVLFSFLFFIIGIIGTYLGYIFEETKKRPIYIVEDIHQKKEIA